LTSAFRFNAEKLWNEDVQTEAASCLANPRITSVNTGF